MTLIMTDEMAKDMSKRLKGLWDMVLSPKGEAAKRLYTVKEVNLISSALTMSEFCNPDGVHNEERHTENKKVDAIKSV